MSITMIPATDAAPAGRPPRRRWRLRVVAVLLAVVLAAVLLWLNGREPSVLSAQDARTAAVGPASATVSVPTRRAATVAMILPVSGTEARWAQGLDRYLQQVRQDETLRCTRARQIPAPAAPAPSFYRFMSLPDLERIGRHGFEVLLDGPPADRTLTPAVEQAQQACLKTAAALTRPVTSTYQAAQSSWFATVDGLRTTKHPSPGIAHARAAIGPCLTARGIPAKDEDGLFSYVDSQVARAGSRAEARRRDGAAGRAYAACAAPLERLLTQELHTLREQFLRDHQDEMRTARDHLDEALHNLTKTSRAALVFPVP